MRPEILFPLFAPVRNLPGVGARLEAALERLSRPRIVDLLWHLPTDRIDRSDTPSLANVRSGSVVTVTVNVDAHHPPARTRQPYRVSCRDSTSALTLVFFHPRLDYIASALPVGAERIVSGTIERYGDTLQMAHPDYIVPLNRADEIPRSEPVYPLTAGLTNKTLARLVLVAVDRAPELEEWLDAAFVSRREWLPWRAALTESHAPKTAADLSPTAPARARLAYDELLAQQLTLHLLRQRMRRKPGRAIRAAGRLAERALATLSFHLTPSQTTAVSEILADMAAERRMVRLLQGDVGCGKTMVAAIAMLSAVESGAQAVIMAPTEILARQHFVTIQPLAEAAGIAAELLTGREKGKLRDSILARLASGKTALAIGTHALFQENVAFKDLALAVIDEQHRFGVHQRLSLIDKGRGTDLLVMTATPIPRTLMMTAYGDMDVSRILDKPPGRRPIDTRVMPLDRLDAVVERIARRLDAGDKVFWVCPLVEESEAVDAAAAEARYDALRQRFGGRVGLAHGRMPGAEKDAAMAGFAGGAIDILVATTIIEVGVDVPAATVMVIEHAERFGLAQLHQLRGRIGRGSRPSTCLLLYAPPLTAAAKARLEILRETEDGFRIAEEDLRLRGGGELLGVRQSGLPVFRVADLEVHADLIAIARDDARLIVDRDPELTSPRGTALRTLLYLFERDQAIKLLRSG